MVLLAVDKVCLGLCVLRPGFAVESDTRQGCLKRRIGGAIDAECGFCLFAGRIEDFVKVVDEGFHSTSVELNPPFCSFVYIGVYVKIFSSEARN